MILMKVDKLKGGEILARDIFYGNATVLIYEGTELKLEYIAKLKELGFEEVYVKNTQVNEKTEDQSIVEEEISMDLKLKLKSLLETHIYKSTGKLEKIKEIAEQVLENVLQNENMTEKVFEIKEHDSSLYEHSLSVCALATITALKLGLEEKRVQDVAMGSLLHDLGFRYIESNISEHKLDEMKANEIKEYKKHPLYGYEALKNEHWLSDTAKAIILSHHESLDGSGFPLKQKQIPIEVKIVSLCDEFDSMICGRGKEKMKISDALEYIKVYKKTKFDSDISEVFFDSIVQYPVGTSIKLNTGEVGVVIRQNGKIKDRPVLKMLYKKDGTPYKKQVVIDMLEVRNIFIEEIL